jgi:hypothetical protein
MVVLIVSIVLLYVVAVVVGLLVFRESEKARDAGDELAIRQLHFR